MMLTIIQSPNDLALLTFVFPESSGGASHAAPPAHAVPIPQNCSARVLPLSTNPLSSISQDTTLAFSVPYAQAPQLLDAVREIPLPTAETEDLDDAPEQKKWIMKAAKPSSNSSIGVRSWITNAWTSFLDLLKVCFQWF